MSGTCDCASLTPAYGGGGGTIVPIKSVGVLDCVIVCVCVCVCVY